MVMQIDVDFGVYVQKEGVGGCFTILEAFGQGQILFSYRGDWRMRRLELIF